MSSRNGMSMAPAMAILTPKSPSAQVTQGSPVPAKAMEKNSAVSTAEPSVDDASGARHHDAARSRSKTATSKSWAIRKAVPDARAMRGVASQTDRITARTNPAMITRRAALGPSVRLVRSVTRNAIG